jgi:hypothetical protein
MRPVGDEEARRLAADAVIAAAGVVADGGGLDDLRDLQVAVARLRALPVAVVAVAGEQIPAGVFVEFGSDGRLYATKRESELPLLRCMAADLDAIEQAASEIPFAEAFPMGSRGELWHFGPKYRDGRTMGLYDADHARWFAGARDTVLSLVTEVRSLRSAIAGAREDGRRAGEIDDAR